MGWATPRSFLQRIPKQVCEPMPEPSFLLPDGEYMAANCVVLAAAIFAEPWANKWAQDLLPSARTLDARRLGFL
jgi:hypothetical protein